MQPAYTVCTHNPKIDVYISARIQAGHAWEADISRLLATMLNSYGVDSVLLDVGSNIGSHSLYAAALGHHVWSVDALTMNHVKLFHAAANMTAAAGSSPLVHQIQHIVDDHYHTTYIQIRHGNIGGSAVPADDASPIRYKSH